MYIKRSCELEHDHFGLGIDVIEMISLTLIQGTEYLVSAFNIDENSK